MKTFPLDETRWAPLTLKEITAIRLVLNGGDYTRTVSEEMAALSFARSGRELPVSALSKIRGELLVLRAMEASRNFSKVSSQAVHRYESKGEGIYEIASSLNQPAMACFRAVLKSRGLSDSSIKAGTQGSKAVLQNDRDVQQQKIAALHDHATTAHEDNSVAASLLFEAEIQRFLDHHQVQYKTQNELKKPGQLTPDFLLTSPVKFGKHEVHWIDAKDFFGGASPFMSKKTKTQASKYIDAFGSGAMVYSRGLTLAHQTGELPEKCLAMDFRWLGKGAVDAVVPPPITVKKQCVDLSGWIGVFTELSTGSYIKKLDKKQVVGMNAKIAQLDPDAMPYTANELNLIRSDLLRGKAADFALPRAVQRKLYERWSNKREDLLQLCEEHGCPPHIGLQVVSGFALEEEGNPHHQRLQTIQLQVDKYDLSQTRAIANPQFHIKVNQFLVKAGVECELDPIASTLVVKPGFQLRIQDKPVKWLVCHDGLAGAVPPSTLKQLRQTVDRMRKTFGGQGAILFSLGVVPGFEMFGGQAELVVDYRHLMEEDKQLQ
ncbi:hypothetical protein BASA81_003295 [Batrachochytrium salamandrivorans]|nr:hypothetical protein BASA81_003295 [Batrachochytrium salamandrivorans]